MLPTQILSVHKSIEVRASVEQAFLAFTQQMHRWWPKDHHIGSQPFVQIVCEPRNTGRWYEVSADGSECQWGTVLLWEPPIRVRLSWHLDGDFRFDPDPQRASEVEVTFTSIVGGRTRLDLEHRHMERHGPSGERLRDAVDDPNGWTLVLGQYVTWANENANAASADQK
jgi:Activator of Hsp90 ATPase homolog 1-like protein